MMVLEMKRKRENSPKTTVQLNEEIHYLKQKIQDLEKKEEQFKTIEKDLRQKEENFLDFFNSIPIGLYRSTPDGEILDANDSLVRMLGFPDKKNLLSKKVPDLFLHKKDRQKETKVLLEKGDIRRYEIPLRRHDGRVIWVEDYAHVIRDERGSVLCYEGSIIDITERKKAETAILDAKEAAEEASRIKSQFLANISHEIRTPMNGIIATAELINESELTNTQKELLSIIKISSESLMKIINAMLDLTHMGSGRFKLENVIFNLKEMIKNILDQLVLKAKKKKLMLTYHFGSGIPDHLFGDPTRITQITLNIINNAIKFCKEGEIKFQVRKESQDQNSILLHFSVADTGIGVPENYKEKIFEAFTQVDGSFTRKYGGTGLGISISKLLVEMMGGQIWVDSPNPDSSGDSPGSVFHFTIPFKTEKSGKPVGKPKVGIKPDDIFKKRDLHCLLVEDNPINQKIITRIIEQLGIKVDLAKNGKMGVQKAKKESYNIIFMDIQMPVMSGLEATKRIKEAGLKTPIIALTAHAMKGDEEKCLKAGMDGYISKPVKKDHIFRVLRKFLN